MIFEEQVSRKPDHYPWTQNFIEAMHKGFWTDKEFKFPSDIQDFKVVLTDQERLMISRALATIGQLEISVKKFWAKLGDHLPHPSINDMGYVMAHTEVIHGDAYERLLEILGIDGVFEDILKLDIIKGRVNYLKKHLNKSYKDDKKQFIYSLIIFTLFVENIALFAQFYLITWFGRYRNLLKDTNKQVEYTSREENLHAIIGMTLVNVIRKEHPELFDDELKEKILKESEEAVEYEMKIIEWIINGYSENKLNSNILKEFIKNRMNNSLETIGYNKIFDIDKKLLAETDWFEEQLLGNNASDFFHTRPTEYSKKSQSFSEEDLF